MPIFKMIWKLNIKLWANEISRKLSLTWTSFVHIPYIKPAPPWNIISYRHIGETYSDYFRKLEQIWYDVPQ